MHVGFTGTQQGMTATQKAKVGTLFRELGITHLHHGDCIGADAEAHKIAMNIGAVVVLHPPTNPSKRAFCKASIVMPAKDYLVRNRHIVDATTVLVATPKAMEEELRSGTCSTVRYARRQKRQVFVVYPGGTVV